MGSEIEEIIVQEQKWMKEKKIGELPKAKSEWGTEAKVLYTPADVKEIDYLRDIGFSGEYPFTRGVYPGMYRRGPWQMRLYAGFGTAEETNQRWKFLLKSGNMGVGCAFDLPTQLGLDSDDPLAMGEVGRVGVAIDTLKDMEILYDGLPLDQIVSSFNINAPCAILLAMYVILAEKQGIATSKLQGTLANDLLCEYVSRGCWIFPPSPSLRLSTDIVEYCRRNLPRFYPYNIRTILMREAGATGAQEVGFGFSNAITYIEEALKRGLNIDEFASRISFFFCGGPQIFEEAAKYRAARRLWAKLMKERFRAKKSASMLLRFTGIFGGSYYRAQEPEVNLIRGAYGLLGQVLGGAQGMLHPAMDEVFAIPTERTHRLALRTQQICAYETGIMKTVDPLGGSYYVEALTNQMEEEIIQVMKGIEDLGGAVKAIETGYMQRWIAEEAYRKAMEEESGERTIIGVNKFRVEEEEKMEMTFHKLNPEVVNKQLKRLEGVKAERNKREVQAALNKLQQAAKGEEKLMPYIIEAVKSYATIGEITNALKEVFGEYQEPVAI